jgi:hypothetical protein
VISVSGRYCTSSTMPFSLDFLLRSVPSPPRYDARCLSNLSSTSLKTIGAMAIGILHFRGIPDSWGLPSTENSIMYDICRQTPRRQGVFASLQGKYALPRVDTDHILYLRGSARTSTAWEAAGSCCRCLACSCLKQHGILLQVAQYQR